MISEFHFPLLAKRFLTKKKKKKTAWRTYSSLPTTFLTGLCCSPSFSQEGMHCAQNEQGCHALSSSPWCNGQGKEGKNKSLFYFCSGEVLGSPEKMRRSQSFPLDHSSVQHKRGSGIDKCLRSSCHQAQKLWLAPPPTEALRTSNSYC